MQLGTFSRRWLLSLALAAACGRAARNTSTATNPGGRKKLPTDPANAGLAARPQKPLLPAPPGLSSFGLTPGSRDALLYVPPSYVPERPLPLLLLLHGARGGAQGIIVP